MATVPRNTFFELFGCDPGADLLIHKRSGVVNCWPLTIKEYEKLEAKIAEAYSSLDRITDEDCKKDIQFYGKLFQCRDKLYFFPAASWTTENVLEWFAHINFTPIHPSAHFENQLTGQSIIHSNSLKLFNKRDWRQLMEKYSIYCQRLKTHWRGLVVKTFRKPDDVRLSSYIGGDALNVEAFKVPYISLPYSGEDFMAVVKEVKTGRPYMPPGHIQIDMDDIQFLAPYTTMVQSSCMGKTRFLYDPIKEDDNSRSLVIYLTNNNSDLYCLLEKAMGSIAQVANLLAYAYEAIIDEVVDMEGFLKKQYCVRGGVTADSILDKMEKPLPDIVTNFVPKNRHLKVRSANGKEKELFVVIAIDEAHRLLDRKTNIYRKKLPEIAVGEFGDQLKKKIENRISDELEILEDLANESYGINHFSAIRRALMYIESTYDLRVPLLLISTNPLISTFMPHFEYFPVLQEILESTVAFRYRRLHRPMLLQETMDVFAREIVIDGNCGAYIRSQEYIKNLFLHGRPFLGAHENVDSEIYPIRQYSILRLAEKIFLAGFKPGIETEVDALALLGQTVYIEPVTTSKFASALVEYRLGILQRWDNLHHSFVAAVHPEPVLSLVATEVLFKPYVNSLESLLKAFCRMTEVGDANIGADGEFVVRLAFYVARMLAAPADPIERGVCTTLEAAFPRKLTDVLKFLAPIEAIENSIAGDLLDSMVNFTHWIKLELLEQKMGDVKIALTFEHSLEQALVRSSALIMPSKEGVDLAIPMVTKSGKLGVLFINVKNYLRNDDVVQTETFLKMSLFAESAQMQGRCLYALAFTSPKKDDQKATISSLADNTVETLRNRHVIEADYAAFPAFIIQGVNNDFGEGRKKPPYDCMPPFLSQDRIIKIRKHLADLANMYRDSHSRFVPEYAHYYQRDVNIFHEEQPEESLRSEAISQPREADSGSCEAVKKRRTSERVAIRTLNR